VNAPQLRVLIDRIRRSKSAGSVRLLAAFILLDMIADTIDDPEVEAEIGPMLDSMGLDPTAEGWGRDVPVPLFDDSLTTAGWDARRWAACA
jgi:hypothetical protein